MRGVVFEIPNDYGKYLAEILDVVNMEKFDWKQCGWNESYVIENGELGKDLFEDAVMSGELLRRLISEQEYYLIFVDLKAFPKNSLTSAETVSTYQEFLESDCQLVLLLVDSSFVNMYVKDPSVTKDIYAKAVNAGFEDVAYITDENDTNTSLIC